MGRRRDLALGDSHPPAGGDTGTRKGGATIVCRRQVSAAGDSHPLASCDTRSDGSATGDKVQNMAGNDQVHGAGQAGKRQAAVDWVKSSPEWKCIERLYNAYTLPDALEAPDGNAALTKRQWELKMCEWRKAIRRECLRHESQRANAYLVEAEGTAAAGAGGAGGAGGG